MGKKPDIQGFFISGVVGTLMLIFFIIIGGMFFNAMKESSPNEQTKELIEAQENNFWNGVNMWVLITGIAGTIGFGFLVFNIVKWAIEEFGGGYVSL